MANLSNTDIAAGLVLGLLVIALIVLPIKALLVMALLSVLSTPLGVPALGFFHSLALVLLASILLPRSRSLNTGK